jgi:hypothetical protein
VEETLQQRFSNRPTANLLKLKTPVRPGTVESKNGGVPEWLKPAVLKNTTAVPLSNTTKSLCQLRDSENFCFLDLLRFCLICAVFSYNPATVGLILEIHTSRVASKLLGSLLLKMATVC